MAASYLDDLADFVVASPSSFHAAAEVARRLLADGFVAQPEDVGWLGAADGVAVRDGAVVAWRLPASLDPARAEIRMVGSHTDSPGFKLKPLPSFVSNGWQQAGLEVYGGPLLNSWLDREFGLAGQVTARDGSTTLITTGAWLRIPQLAPHLDRSVHENLHLDKQHHLQPVLGVDGMPDDLVGRLAALAGFDHDELVGHDLISYSIQPPAVFGTHGQLFASARLDNLISVHAALRALRALPPASNVITILAAFDHEEVGSASRTGASGPFLAAILRRIASGLGWTTDQWEQVLARSFHISADAGHVVHPNYAQLHDPVHRPVPNAGPLLKVNANQRYATDAPGQARWHRACADAGVPSQVFVSNSAVPCGSTIGPLTATRLGIRTVDVGVGLLSMHSARELCGVDDPGYLAAALTAFYAG